MAILTLTINDPLLQSRAAEVGYIQNAVAIAMQEIGGAQGNRTSGTILGMNSTSQANSSLGSWTYTSSAGKP